MPSTRHLFLLLITTVTMATDATLWQRFVGSITDHLTGTAARITNSFAGTAIEHQTSGRDHLKTRDIQVIASGPRRGERVVKRARLDSAALTTYTVGHEANNEMDTRADTSCLGSNWRPVVFTGQMCNVKGFHEGLGGMSEIPVATCATAWDHPINNKTYILLLHKGLYFGKSLDHSLINQNQVRYNDVELYDNPFDEGRPFGIIAGNITIPFDSQGSTIFFKSMFPTDDELKNCAPVHLTSEQTWDPHSVKLPNRRDTWPEENEDLFNPNEGE